MGRKRKSQLLSASEPENKRDWYQECFHVETASADRNDTMNEQARGVKATTPIDADIGRG